MAKDGRFLLLGSYFEGIHFMLVVSRKKNEVVMIDGCIEIRIVSVRGDKVRLGITAPREIPVHRGEVQARIDEERRNGL